MSILFMDNFEFYGDKAELLKGTAWVDNYSGVSNSVAGIQDDPAGTGKKVLRVGEAGSDSDSSFRLAVPVPGNKIGVAFRWYLDAMPSTSYHGAIIAWKTSGNSHKYGLRVTPTGQLVFFRSNDAGIGTAIALTSEADACVTLATSAPLVMSANAWKHIEAVIDTTTGVYEVRVEGVQVISGTDGSPAIGDIGIVGFYATWDVTAAGEPRCYVKDVVIWDDNGTANNNFVGPVTVYSLVVNGDVSSGWTRSSGTTDYARLDENTPDDTDYIQAGDPPPAASIMNFANLPADVVAVRALQTVVRAKKTDGGDAKLQVGLISNGDTDTGADGAVNTSFRYHWDVSEFDPDTAAAWTPTAVNAATIQLNRTI